MYRKGRYDSGMSKERVPEQYWPQDRPLSRWELKMQERDDHSQWFIERFENLAAAGEDLAGEARFADALAPRHATIVDAGSGHGRIGIELAHRGHDVIGVDVDPILIAEADRLEPSARWVIADIAVPEVLSEIAGTVDLIVCGGNVITFLAPGTTVHALNNFRLWLKPSGRAVVGFGAGRGYEWNTFRQDVQAAGLHIDYEFSTWDGRPFTASSDFIVAVLSQSVQ